MFFLWRTHLSSMFIFVNTFLSSFHIFLNNNLPFWDSIYTVTSSLNITFFLVFWLTTNPHYNILIASCQSGTGLFFSSRNSTSSGNRTAWGQGERGAQHKRLEGTVVERETALLVLTCRRCVPWECPQGLVRHRCAGEVEVEEVRTRLHQALHHHILRRNNAVDC